MDYECQTIPIDQVIVDAAGLLKPLCDSCSAPDCTNPIREQTVYVIGIPKKLRLWVVNKSVRQVVACQGYSEDKKDNSDD